MPLPTNLNTNEVKDRTGTEVEFLHFSQEGRTHIYAKKDAPPGLPHQLKVAHQETGTGYGLVRRSAARIDINVVGKSGKVVPVSMYQVAVVPLGELDDLNTVKDACAELLSFCATTGAGTTVLFDCSGNGADCLVNGTQ